MRKKLLTMVTVLLLTMLFLVGCGEQKIDLTQYVSVSYKGLNGKATANVDVDYVELEKILWNSEENELDNLYTIAVIEESISCKADKTSDLSNGDKINITITWDEELVKEAGFKFTGKQYVIEVTGLEDGVEIDLFEDISIQCEGVSPSATAKVINSSENEWIKGLNFRIEDYTGLANGDIVTVEADCSQESAEYHGYIIEETKKEFVIEGADEYVSNYSQIDEVTLEQINTYSSDLIESQLTQSYLYKYYIYPGEFLWDEVHLKSVEIVPCYAYFQNVREELELSWYGAQNKFVIVYNVTITDEVTPEGKSVLLPVYYEDIVLQGDDKIIVDYNNAYIVESYKEYEEMYRAIVTSKKADYNSEEIIFE